MRGKDSLSEDTSQPTAQPEEQSFDFRPYLEVIRKRLWIVVAVAVVCGTATYFHISRKPRVYRATAKVVIDPRPPQVLGSQVQEVVQLGPTGWTDMQYSDYYNTQIDVITGFDLAKATVLHNELWRDERLVPRRPGDTRDANALKAAATQEVWRSLRATRSRNSRIVRFHSIHSDPAVAVLIVNAHVKTYIAYVRDVRQTGSAEASKFLSTELDTAAEKLRVAEDALLAFKRSNDALSVSLEDRQSILARDLAQFSSALSTARIERMEIEAALAQARLADNDDIFESPIFALASNTATVDALKTEYMRQKQQLVELSKTLGPKNPTYLQQKTTVDEVYAQVEREVRRARRELEVEYKAALTSERKLETEVEKLKQQGIDLEPKTVEYGRLQREKKSAEENFNLVMGRLKTSELSGRNTAINVRPQESARYAGLVGQRLRMKVAFGSIFGLMLGFGLALLLHFLDRTIKDASQLERAVGISVLGIIPVIDDKGTAPQGRDLHVHSQPRAPAAECCRAIRTNILFAGADKPLRVLTISSPNPRDGKTTSAISLGTTIAQSGARVLLVDSDLRRPRLHAALGTTRTVGLTNLILGDSEIEDVVKTTDVPNLYLLPCGPQPPNPAELLLTNRFNEVLSELSSRYDFVLLDSPPILAVTDAVVLARRSDGIILVAQADKTTVDDVKHCARALSDVNANVIGIVLNNIDLTRRKYYYQYAYRYGGEYAADT